MPIQLLIALMLAPAIPAFTAEIRVEPVERKDTLFSVRVVDVTGTPIPDASVTFELPRNGPGGSFGVRGVFKKGARRLLVRTDSEGLAVAAGFQPNKRPGDYAVTVAASHGGKTETTTLVRSNGPAEITATDKSRGLGASVFVLSLGAISLIGTLLSL